MLSLTEFLSAIEEIASENPSYRKGGSGFDGTCDCIGLIIGALALAGFKWPGVHGSNWAARNAMTQAWPQSASIPTMLTGCCCTTPYGPW